MESRRRGCWGPPDSGRKATKPRNSSLGGEILLQIFLHVAGWELFVDSLEIPDAFGRLYSFANSFNNIRILYLHNLREIP